MRGLRRRRMRHLPSRACLAGVLSTRQGAPPPGPVAAPLRCALFPAPSPWARAAAAVRLVRPAYTGRNPPRLLFETGLPTRYYLPVEDVRRIVHVSTPVTVTELSLSVTVTGWWMNTVFAGAADWARLSTYPGGRGGKERAAQRSGDWPRGAEPPDPDHKILTNLLPCARRS
jgi:hypothetical protein